MLPAEQPARTTVAATNAAAARTGLGKFLCKRIMPVQPRPVAPPGADQPSHSEAKLLLIQAIALKL
jgi:hypothetical protein